MSVPARRYIYTCTYSIDILAIDTQARTRSIHTYSVSLHSCSNDTSRILINLRDATIPDCGLHLFQVVVPTSKLSGLLFDAYLPPSYALENCTLGKFTEKQFIHDVIEKQHASDISVKVAEQNFKRKKMKYVFFFPDKFNKDVYLPTNIYGK